MARTWNNMVKDIIKHGEPHVMVKTKHTTMTAGTRRVELTAPEFLSSDSMSIFYDGKLTEMGIFRVNYNSNTQKLTLDLLENVTAPTTNVTVDIKFFSIKYK